VQWLLGKVADLTFARPRTVLLLCLILTAVSGAAVPHLRIITSRDAMVPPDNPYRKALDDFLREFGGMGDLIVVAEGDDPETLAAFADDVAARLSDKPEVVAEVFHKVPIDFFKDKAFLYLPVDHLGRMADEAEKHRGRIKDVAAIKGLPDLIELMDEGLAETMKAGPAMAEDAPLLIALLTGFFEELAQYLDGKDQPIRVIEKMYSRLADEAGMGVDPKGYLRSRDKGLIFVFTRSALSDELPDVIRFVETVHEQVDAARAGRAGISGAGLTGFPAHTYEDMTTVLSDLVTITVLSLIGIIILFAVAFRSAIKTIVAMLPVVSGSLWALALTFIIYGHVNLLSSAFFVILIGMGIDFGIHTVARFDEERRKGLERDDAIRATLLRAGRGIVTSALTSAAAFFAIGFVEFAAFAELGVIAGCGLLAVLLATLFELPALLALVSVPPPRPLPANRSPLPERLVQRMLSARAPLLIAAVIGLGAAIWGTTQIPFDYNYMNLLPRGSESAVYQAKMVERSDFSAEFSAFVADSLVEANRISEALRSKPTVARVESINQLVPDGQESKLKVLERLRPMFADLDTRYADLQPVDGAALGEALEALLERVEHAQELAFSANKAPVVNALGELLEALETVGEKSEGAEASKRATLFQNRLFSQLAEQLTLFKDNLERTEGVTVAQVPESLRKRFASGKGFAVYAFPKGSIWDRAFLEQFVEDSLDVHQGATGFAIRHWGFASTMHRDFGYAGLGAGMAILLMLLLDFRSPYRALLAALPLGFGVVWMLGLMRVFEIEYNFANLPGVPLIIGIGVASGVHLVHRYAQDGERNVPLAVVGTGRAILLSALTTMLAFGTLGISRHRGLASFGWVLLIGVGCCLIASLVVLPAVLELVRRFKDGRASRSG